MCEFIYPLVFKLAAPKASSSQQCFFLFSQSPQPNPSLTLELQNSEVEKQSSNTGELETKSLIKLLISHSIKAKILLHLELDFLMWTGVRWKIWNWHRKSSEIWDLRCAWGKDTAQGKSGAVKERDGTHPLQSCSWSFLLQLLCLESYSLLQLKKWSSGGLTDPKAWCWCCMGRMLTSHMHGNGNRETKKESTIRGKASSKGLNRRIILTTSVLWK